MNIEDFKQTFQKLDKSNMHLLDSIYAPQIVFQDPLHRIQGLPALTDYFQHMYQNVTDIEFKFLDQLQQAERYLLIWDMYLTHPRLNAGKSFVVPGCSHLVFEEKCISHRDYFDLGALLYENITGLGAVIRWIKGRA